MKVQQDIPLAPLTTLGVGGKARYFIDATTMDDVKRAVMFAHERNRQLFVLGGGSNLLIADRGYRGVVMKMSLRGMRDKGMDAAGKRVFAVAAGEDWDGFVAHTVSQGCSGVECLSGIPGTVGGTPIQNVGAYGQEVAETIQVVKALDLVTMEVRTFANTECGFTYRSSIFNTTEKGKHIVLVVEFALTPNGRPRAEYADLKRYFAEHKIESPTVNQARDAVREIRHSKAMLVVAGDEDCRSAGSFFKNPIVTEAEYADIVKAASDGKHPPKYAVGAREDGIALVKTSAAWLVENAGFAKGIVRGNVGISKKHSLAIVNCGGATANEILDFKSEIAKKVKETFGITLQMEPVMVGFTE